MTDFAEVTYAITAVFRGEHMDDAAMTVLDRRVTEALRRMYAAGVAEGMAKAAEIARAQKQRDLEAMKQEIVTGAEALLCMSTADQIAEAILAASPPPPDDEDGGWRSQQEWQALLDGRDKFIVDQGLWRDFVRSL